MLYQRRQFMQIGAQTAGLLAAGVATPGLPSRRAAAAEVEPHFFLEVFFPGGMDCLYTFDARPLAMTAANLQVNYQTEEPTLLRGSNGQTALVSPLVQPLLAHFDHFSILNGIIMVPGFDGHDNNTAYFDTGNAFGGASFLPHLNERNQGGVGAPIDVIKSGGGILSTPTNAGNSVALMPSTATQLAKRLRSANAPQPNTALFRQLRSRMTANSRGGGRFSAAAAAMVAAADSMPGLTNCLSALDFSGAGAAVAGALATLTSQMFIHGVTRSVQLGIDASIIPGLNLDTHDGISAAATPQAVAQCMQLVAALFQHLRSTPYDVKRSLLDVTTVMVGTEFGRTMRRAANAGVSASGTDHNALKNTVLLGGKGIKAGLIVGATDQQGDGLQVSAAHQSLDAEGIKAMGRPLDFASLLAAVGSPQVYNAQDYLDFSCIANTVYEVFGVSAALHRRLGKDGPLAATLKGLLV